MISLVLQACGTRDENILIVKDIRPAESVKTEIIDVPGLFHPTRLYRFGDKLLMKDDISKECQMYIYDLRSGELTRARRKGRGPGESIGAFYFAMTLPDSVVVVNDITLVNMLEMPLDSLDKDWYISTRKTTGMVDGINSGAICGYEDNNLLVMASYEDARFVVYDLKDTSVVRKIVYSPDTVHWKCDRLVMTSYGGVIKYSPVQKKSVIACRFADQLEIYNFAKIQKHLGVFRGICVYISDHIMTRRYGKLIQSYSYSQFRSAVACFVRSTSGGKEGSVRFHGYGDSASGRYGSL